MLQARACEREQIDQCLAALRSLPEVQADLESAGAPALDVPVAMDVAGKPIHALVELRKAVYPRAVWQLIWRIRDFARQQPAGDSGGEPLAVLVAESISPGAKELLRAERVGYFDCGGSLYLPARGPYLYVDRPPPKSLSRSMRILHRICAKPCATTKSALTVHSRAASNMPAASALRGDYTCGVELEARVVERRRQPLALGLRGAVLPQHR